MLKMKRFLFFIVFLGFLIFLSPVSSDSIKCEWDGVARIVAVGDVHGDFEQFVRILTATGCIDEENNWTGKETHLVQTGDILDRGPHSKQVMDLLMKLEKQANQSGGWVHVLIGNHEAMNIYGDFRYVHDGEKSSHGGSKAFKKAMKPDGYYGAWIIKHNAVIRINDILFLHGGLTAPYATMELNNLNTMIRRELQSGKKRKGMATTDSDGPLWYRGYALEEDETVVKKLEQALEFQKTEHMVIGHTVEKGGIHCRFDNRVIMIDVGMSQFYYEGPPSCLVVEHNSYYELCAQPLHKKLLFSKKSD